LPTRHDIIVRTIVVGIGILLHALAMLVILWASLAEIGLDIDIDLRRVALGLLLLLLVDIAWLAWRPRSGARRASAPNTCRQCGYLLIGNVSGTCPECGQATFLSSSARRMFHDQRPPASER
jgi:hypothetical protein